MQVPDWRRRAKKDRVRQTYEDICQGCCLVAFKGALALLTSVAQHFVQVPLVPRSSTFQLPWFCMCCVTCAAWMFQLHMHVAMQVVAGTYRNMLWACVARCIKLPGCQTHDLQTAAKKKKDAKRPKPSCVLFSVICHQRCYSLQWSPLDDDGGWLCIFESFICFVRCCAGVPSLQFVRWAQDNSFGLKICSFEYAAVYYPSSSRGWSD